MKILHTSDWHLGAYAGPQCDDPLKRMKNTIKCLDAIVDTSRKEEPDIILVAGDIFHQAKVWSDRGNIELRTAARYIERLAEEAPVAVLYGTPNHDSMEMFNNLTYMLLSNSGVWIFTEPRIYKIETKAGSVQIAGLPGLDKGSFRSQFPGISAEDENKMFSEQLKLIIERLSSQVDISIPSVLMAHHTVVERETEKGQNILYLQNEVILKAASLDNSRFQMVCLGHIHTGQRVRSCLKEAYYSGSVDAFTFNDEGHDKGFFIHNIASGQNYHKFVKTPSRQFLTIIWNKQDIEKYIKGESYFGKLSEDVKNKVVRVLYICDYESEKSLDKKKLEKDIYAAGAYYVHEIRLQRAEEVVNREGLHEKLSIWDSLVGYLHEKKVDKEEIQLINDTAYPIIQTALASHPMGNQMGIFLPIEIQVRNYRSYEKENMSFQDVFFAMVNGRNGIGKSSFFMDAIVDCLYEQPREGELTGWIRAGERSGSISFTFQLGNSIYRVARTRQKSGKATLALARKEQSNGSVWDIQSCQWTDLSSQKLTDTQEKIIQLLGMDADTFRSCILIMQDQYGRFMEAKPEERISVLGSLLGLGIYSELEEETRKQLQDVNREVRVLKEEISALEEDVLDFDNLKNKMNSTEEQLRTISKEISLLKERKEEASKKTADLKFKIHEHDRLMDEANIKTAKAKEKDAKLKELTEVSNQTKEFLMQEELLNSKHLELNELKEKLAGMESTKKLLDYRLARMDALKSEREGLSAERSNVEEYIKKLESKLFEFSAIEEQEKKLRGVEEELVNQEEKKLLSDKLTQRILFAENKVSQNNNSIKELEAQTLILENSSCIDIEKAQCGFLRSAKQAAQRIIHLQKTGVGFQKELEELKNQKESILYDAGFYSKIKSDVESYRKLNHQLTELAGDKKILSVYTERSAALSVKLYNIKKHIENLNIEISSLLKDLKDYDMLKNHMLELLEYEKQWSGILDAKAYLNSILPQINGLSAEIQELSLSAAQNRNIADELAIQISDYEKYENDIKDFEINITKHEEEAAKLNRTIGSIEEKLLALEQKKSILTGKKESMGRAASKASRLQVLSEAFGQDGIPHQIIRDIVPELEASANEILTQMTRGKMRMEFRTERTLKTNKGKEVATLDIVIIDVEHGVLPYLSRSGGQKVRASLAVSFALAMIKASRVGLQLGMMFVDEPPFLDDEGVEAYCMALQAIHGKYPEMRIVAISHDENMKAMFPQQLLVVDTEHGSKVMKH